MFDANEINDKTLVEKVNGFRTIEFVEKVKSVYFINTRTNDKFKLVLNKQNGSSYKGILFKELDDKNIENTILANGKISVFVCKAIITIYFKENKFYIIASDEIEIFE